MSDDDQTLPAAGGRDDDDLVGPRRGGASRPSAGPGSGGSADAGPRGGEDELVGRRRTRFALDDDDEDDVPAARPRPARALTARTAAASGDDSMLAVVRDVPRFLKMLVKLMRDGRVSRIDKAIVGAALAYMALPIDLIPEAALPVLGYVEDVYLLALAVSRLMNNAGIEVLLEHWDGDSASLQGAMAALDRASATLPAPLRSILGGRS